MIWELTYTSAAHGPTGRSGFQFVAVSPGTPPDVTHAVTPYMACRPPPDAPSAPRPDEFARFPASFTYGRDGRYAVLTRCRYTGRDYSGRHGNFLGQAIVATHDEMEGLRPIEFWDSPQWDAETPAGRSATELRPGDAFDPDTLAGRLAAERAHDRLVAVLDAVTTALTGGHGRVVLVSEDVELIARWIAVVSYSLPSELAAGLSFTTYTSDPDTAPHLLVGTVPAAWPRGGFRLDEPPGRAPGPPETREADGAGERPSRFARVVADCWSRGDLDGIDAVGGLIAAGGVSSPDDPITDGGIPALDGAAALLALCRGDTSVSADEQAAAAALIRDREAPAWAWPSLRSALPAVGFELAAVLAATVPEAAEHCVRLALEDPGLRRRLPPVPLRDGLREDFRAALAATPDLRALAGLVDLADRVGGALEPEDVIAAAAACARRGAGEVAAAIGETPPAVRGAMISGVVTGLEAAVPQVRRRMLTPEACAALGDHDWTRAPRTGGLVLSSCGDRLAATAGLVVLEPHGLTDIEDLLGVLWTAPPTAGECRWLIERLGPAMLRFSVLRALPRRVFDALPLDGEETVRLAELVRHRLPLLADAARTVLAYGEALRAGTEEEVARAIAAIRPGRPLDERVLAGIARTLALRPPASRAGVLTAVPEAVRDGLIRHWLADPDRHGRADLAEIEVRLAEAGATAAPLEAWADGLGRFARRQVESSLTDRYPRLAAAWRRSRRRRT